MLQLTRSSKREMTTTRKTFLRVASETGLPAIFAISTYDVVAIACGILTMWRLGKEMIGLKSVQINIAVITCNEYKRVQKQVIAKQEQIKYT